VLTQGADYGRTKGLGCNTNSPVLSRVIFTLTKSVDQCRTLRLYTSISQAYNHKGCQQLNNGSIYIDIPKDSVVFAGAFLFI